MISISYCVSVCNEHVELDLLLNQLIANVDQEDEIVILVDTSKVTPEVSKVITTYRAIKNIELIGENLNGDFSSFKNNFINKASKDWIFQIDADELLNDEMFLSLKSVLEFNEEIEMFYIPRENYVKGIETRQDLISQWRWKIDERGRINFPDYQQRLFKNNKQIKWKNKVHEVLDGHKTYAALPPKYFIIHNKTLERQIQQNQFYNTL